MKGQALWALFENQDKVLTPRAQGELSNATESSLAQTSSGSSSSRQQNTYRKSIDFCVCRRVWQQN